MRYKHLKTLMAQRERICEKSWQCLEGRTKTRNRWRQRNTNSGKLVFNRANQKLVDFLDELQKLAKDAIGIAAHAIIEQFTYAKMPRHLKKSKNQAHVENGTYEQTVTHLVKELELNGLEAADELKINTVSHKTANTNADRPKPTCHHCKKPGHYRS